MQKLFSGHRSTFPSKRKCSKRQLVATAVNIVSVTERKVPEIWSDVKVEAKKKKKNCIPLSERICYCKHK